MTDLPPPPLGDYNAVPALNLSGMTPDDILAALPPLTPEQQALWQQQLMTIRQAVMSAQNERQQVASVLGSIAAIARSVGLILTVA